MHTSHDAPYIPLLSIEVDRYGRATVRDGKRVKLPPLREIRRVLKETKPWLGAFTIHGGLRRDGIEDPAAMPVVVIPFGTNRFKQYANYIPTPLGDHKHHDMDGDTFWIGGMMAWVVHEVQLLVNPWQQTLILYQMMNNDDHDAQTILGHLVPGHRFTKLVLDRAERFLVETFCATVPPLPQSAPD